MRLADVIRGKGGPWKPELPPHPSYLPDFRYAGTQSCFEVEGDVMTELRAQYAEQVEEHKPRVPVSWDRLLWEEPWEKPPPKPPSEKPPLLVTHVFDALDGCANRPMPARAWLYPMGMSIQRLCYDVCKGQHLDQFVEAWNGFSEAAAISQFSPRNDRSLTEYVMEVEQVMSANTNLQGLWYSFMDIAVETAQAGMKLKSPPLFVILFMNFEFAPGAAQTVVRSLKGLAHPRLVCLFAQEP